MNLQEMDFPRVNECWALKSSPDKIVSITDVIEDEYVYVHMPWAKETFQGKSMGSFLKQYEKTNRKPMPTKSEINKKRKNTAREAAQALSRLNDWDQIRHLLERMPGDGMSEDIEHMFEIITARQALELAEFDRLMELVI